MPKPMEGESQEQFVQRAIRYFMGMEGMERNEAAGKAYGFWSTYQPKKKTAVDTSAPRG